MKVVVIGATGQLGTEIVQAFSEVGCEVVALGHAELDVSDLESARTILTRVAPDVVINTAAYHQVDKCEADPMESFKVNAVAPRNLAYISNDLDFKLVHLSTDYVFDGAKGSPYEEEDLPNPLNVYGNTKLSGELFVKTIAKKHFVVRVSALFGRAPCRAKGGMNFPQLMLHLARTKGRVRVVDDEVVSPTYTVDIAEQLAALTDTSVYGTYHCTSEGSCSWYDLAKRVFEVTKQEVVLEKANSDEFPMKVPRPKYSVLENSALRRLGINIMPPWEDALERYLAER